MHRRAICYVAGGRCVCPYCNKVISNKHNLKTHITDKHTPQTERFLCKLCGRHYSTKHSLATHTSTVHRSRSSPRGAAARAARMAASFVGTHHHTLSFGQPDLNSRRLLSPTSAPIRDMMSGRGTSQDTKDTPLLPSHPFSSPSSSVPSTISTFSPGRGTCGGTSDLGTLGSLLPSTDGLDNVLAAGSSGTPASLADVVANLPSCDPLESSDQIQAMAQSLAQAFPSNHLFPSLSDFDE